RRAARNRARALDLPTTATREEIEAILGRTDVSEASGSSDVFHGIGLGESTVTGTAVVASDLKAILQGPSLPDSPILIAPTLEPSWAIVFPRFAGVVAELGGELSHAAILLREAGIPSVVNARGVLSALASGDRVRLDPARGEIHI